MRFGICCDLQHIDMAQKLGYDFIELNASKWLGGSQADYELLCRMCDSHRTAVEAFNCLIPGKFKVVTPDLDLLALESYLALVFSRAKAVGADVVVFGSGGARSYPNEYPRNKAMKQLRKVLTLMGELASTHNVYLCVEPLNSKECNTINTLAEADQLVRELGLSSVKLTADLWHMQEENESLMTVRDVGRNLYHVHVADSNRSHPGGGTYDYKGFFKALQESGYSHKISCEYLSRDFENTAALALSFLKNMWTSTAGTAKDVEA